MSIELLSELEMASEMVFALRTVLGIGGILQSLMGLCACFYAHEIHDPYWNRMGYTTVLSGFAWMGIRFLISGRVTWLVFVAVLFTVVVIFGLCALIFQDDFPHAYKPWR